LYYPARPGARETLQGQQLSRISGLDPALPLFDIDEPDNRLSTSDAVLVDIVHTCGGWLGFEKPLGHIDFFPNGGVFVQPGCSPDITGFSARRRIKY
jgi:Lipase